MAAPTILTTNFVSFYDLAKLGIDVTNPASFLVNRQFVWNSVMLSVGSPAPIGLTPTQIRRYYQGRFLQAVAPS
jgi:hypothetical protein